MGGSSSRTRSLCLSPHRSERPRDATHLRGFFADGSLINVTPLISCPQMLQVLRQKLRHSLQKNIFIRRIFIDKGDKLRLLESYRRMYYFLKVLFAHQYNLVALNLDRGTCKEPKTFVSYNKKKVFPMLLKLNTFSQN